MKTKQVILRYTLWSTLLAFVPIPVINLIGIGIIQGLMIARLRKLKGELGFFQRFFLNSIILIAASIIPVSLGWGMVGSYANAIPFVGQLGSFFTLPVFCGVSTYIAGIIAAKIPQLIPNNSLEQDAAKTARRSR